jgi:hypothetical protein
VVRGVELLRGKLDTCREVLRELLHVGASVGALPHGGAPSIQVEEGNILDVDVSAADVVYFCATCFAPDLMRGIQRLVSRLKRGTRVLVVDRWLGEATDGWGLRRIGACQVRATWGTAMALILEKV